MAHYHLNSDQELIILLKAGNTIAYTEIYDRYFQLMFIFAYRKLNDEELAKDFVQELFTKVWMKKDAISPNGNLAQYLYISLRSRIFDYFAHQKVQSKFIDFLGTYAESTTEQTDHLIREKQLTAYIEGQIAKLPAKMRAVFELSRNEHMSNREIADHLNTTESNISQHISSAVKILKTKLSILLTYLTL